MLPLAKQLYIQFSLTVIAFLDGLASASPDKRLLPSLTVDEGILRAELAFGWGSARNRKGQWMAEIDDEREGSDRRAGCTGRGESLFVPCLTELAACQDSHVTCNAPPFEAVYKVHHRTSSKPPVWPASQDVVITKNASPPLVLKTIAGHSCICRECVSSKRHLSKALSMARLMLRLQLCISIACFKTPLYLVMKNGLIARL